MKKRNFAILFVAGLMAFTFIPAQGAYALATDRPEEISPEENEYLISDDDPGAAFDRPRARAIVSLRLLFTRASSSKASANLYAQADKNVSKMKSTIYLQKKRGNKYITISGARSSKTVKTNTITHRPSFSVSRNGHYRVKAVITEYKGASSSKKTVYKELS